VAAASKRERQLAIVGGVLAAMAVALLGMAVTSGGAEPAGSAPAARFPGSTPAKQSEVAAFVAACNATTDGDCAGLRELAHRDDALVAGNAIRALGRLRAVHSDPELVAMLHDGRPRVRGEVVLALGECGDPAMAARLQPLLGESDQGTAMLAVQALMRLGATAPVAALAGDPAAPPQLRQFAGAALGSGRVRPLVATTAGLTTR
jgi:hypothetical protein